MAGFAPRLKWPNDLVWPGDGSAPDRKLAGILAEADWPAASSISAGWKAPAAARPGRGRGRHRHQRGVAGRPAATSWPTSPWRSTTSSTTPVDREDLLIALLAALGPRYDALVRRRPRRRCSTSGAPRSATLGRRVRVDLGADDVEGKAVDVTDDGHLVVETLEGERRTFAVGDVVHLRPA